MKKLIIAGGAIVIILIIIFAVAHKNKTVNQTQPTDSTKKQAYFFYLDTCTHCHNVDGYLQSHGAYDKYQITKMDAKNPFNGQLLMRFYTVFGYPEEQRGGVPVVVFGNTMIVGDQPIIDRFEKEMEATGTNQLPDASKITPQETQSTDTTGVPSDAPGSAENNLDAGQSN
jgi:hypothetical protein